MGFVGVNRGIEDDGEAADEDGEQGDGGADYDDFIGDAECDIGAHGGGEVVVFGHFLECEAGYYEEDVGTEDGDGGGAKFI